MNKILKKVLTGVLTVTMAMGCVFAVSGCGNNDGKGSGKESDKGQKVDMEKTQLYVRYSDYGFGNRWLIDAKDRFEKFYADYSFEEGKKGIQVVMDPTANNLLADVTTARDYIYFAESYNTVEWYQYSEDITKMASVSLGDSYGKDVNGKDLPGLPGETKSIKEKMNADETNYFVLNEEGKEKILAIPFIDGYNGTLTYNADIFEKYSLYYDKDNKIGVKRASGNLGLGPDGVAGTADDGLPRTIDELVALCDKMKERGVIPFNWAGNWTVNAAEFFNSLAYTSFGAKTTRELIQGSGTLTNYIDAVIGNNTYSLSKSDMENGNYTVKEKTFTEDTFKDMLNTTAVYKTVEFVQKIIDNKYYKSDDNFSSSYTHKAAQGDFFWGEDKGNDFQYGMLMDGSWWFCEAEPYISQFETLKQKSRNTKDLRYMPLPKADLATWEALKGENFTPSTYFTGIVMKKGLNETQKLISELFIRFFCSDESLVSYTKIISTPRALTYSMSDEDYAELTPYGKTLYSVHAGDAARGYGTSVVQYLRSSTGHAFTNASDYTYKYAFESRTYGSDILRAFKDHKATDNYSSYEYFKDLLFTEKK